MSGGAGASRREKERDGRVGKENGVVLSGQVGLDTLAVDFDGARFSKRRERPTREVDSRMPLL